MLYHEAEKPCLFQGIAGQIGRKLPAQDVGRVQSEPADPDGVEGLNQARALVMAEAAHSLTANVHRGIRNFKLNQQGDPSLYEGKHFVKRGNRLGSTAKAAGFHLLIGQIFYRVRAAAEPFQCVVVKDYQPPVPGKVEVDFNTVPFSQRGAKGRHGIFGNTLLYAVIPSVGEHGVPITAHVSSAGEARRDGEYV